MACRRNPIVVVLILFGIRLFAQTGPCLRRSLSVNILMPQGTMAPTLTAGELRATVGKEPVKILSVLPDDPPHRIIVLLDSSGSVLSTPLVWRAYLAMARNFVTNQPEGTTVTLAVFADQIDMVIPVTNDRVALDSKFKSLEAGWGFFRRPRATALWDALKTASDMFSPPRQGDVIYAFTDGVDNASRIHVEDLENTFRSKPIRLLLISVRGTAQPRAFAKELQKLQDLVIETGGATAEISRKALEKKSQFLSQSIPRLYRMGIELPAQLKNTEKSRVIVTGPTIEGIDVNYSGGLAPCPNTTPENAAH
jgi:hypothetical protein